MYFKLTDKPTMVDKRKLIELVSTAVQLDILTVGDLLEIRTSLLKALNRIETATVPGAMLSESDADTLQFHSDSCAGSLREDSLRKHSDHCFQEQ